MASFDQYHDRNNKVRDSSPGNIHHGFSKTQACLNKILYIISSFKHGETSKEPSLEPQIDGSGDETASLSRTRRFDIDLNLRLGTLPETEEEFESPAGEGGFREAVESNSPAISVEGLTVEKCLDSEFDADCGFIKANHVDVKEEKATEVSEVANSQIRSFETDNNGVCTETEVEQYGNTDVEYDHRGEGVKAKSCRSNECKSEGFMGMLIEAAKLISGEFEEDEVEAEKLSQNDELGRELVALTLSETENTNRSQSGSKRSHCDWTVDLYGDFGDISPVVKSKRGRSQVLPHRYRDSVIEPWRRLSKQKSTTVTMKRRSR